VPAIFCTCALCKEARRRGGKEIRRRTAYLLGDTIMVDFGPDAYHSMIALGLDYSPLRHLLISHSHQDHWAPEDLAFRQKGFSVLEPGSVLTIHGNEAVGARLTAALPELERYALQYRPAKAFEEVALGEGWTAVPLLANHGAPGGAFNWLVRGPAGAVLFGNDTGWYPAPTWDFLTGEELVTIFMDSTSGQIPSREGHLGARVVVEVRDMMEKIGALGPRTRFIAVHFSHNGGMLHDELEEFYAPYGIEVAYDGLAVGVGT
jgi:phosphoribosyl 1,2-cyclic phosphate phosphodiesterase